MQTSKVRWTQLLLLWATTGDKVMCWGKRPRGVLSLSGLLEPLDPLGHLQPPLHPRWGKTGAPDQTEALLGGREQPNDM